MRPRSTDLGPSVEQAVALYAAGYFPMDDPDEQHNPLPFYAAEERAVFELDEADRATHLRTGAEPDLGMGTVQLQ